MPIFFQQDIDGDTKLAVWKIEEEESFFTVPLQREITHPHKRLQHLSGRYLLRYLFPEFPLDLIKVADTRKPYLEDEAFHFSISHCSDYAAAIVSRKKRVGVDIEVPTKKVERIKKKFLHAEELMFVNSHKATNRTEAKTKIKTIFEDSDNALAQLTLLWSVKEAVYKWWSYGGVDFSEMIRIEPFTLQEKGEIRAMFLAPEAFHPLPLHYRMFNGICLAWVTA
ncbi:4'-phosphopantetheinyl transferase superfamily protein [Flavisolibacter sp. BT320]|nr:4'-phosphopantetheinyl transferase superfamily protein [Flavisolibacter longurius]